MLNITNDIYPVGVLNPNMRIFDIVMRTEYGTSYNSYIITGGNGGKIALIDGCHERFTEAFIKNIRTVTDIKNINYVIVNHCEPDHTGALREIVNLAPNVEFYCTAAGKIFLSNIIKTPLKIHVVTDGEIINLGDKTLQFIIAPFLHWPDSMFTYCKERKTVFTCDFLGCHYCEPQIFDDKISYVEHYKKAVTNYYDAIFSPFSPYVKQGIEKIKKLDVQYACTSHGPVLAKGTLYDYVLNYYWKRCTEENKKLFIPVIYASAYGYTTKIAKALQEGILSVDDNIICTLFDVNEHELCELTNIVNNAQYFCIGSPTLNKNAVHPIWDVINGIDAINSKNKIAIVFGSFGWSGEAQKNIETALTALQIKIFSSKLHYRFLPTHQELEEAKNIGKSFAAEILKNNNINKEKHFSISL